MRRVLVIAYLYPPVFNSGTRRSLEFVNHLPDQGWTPVVLTLANPPPRECDDSLLDEVRQGTRIERAPQWGAHLGERIGTALGARFNRRRLADALDWRVQHYWNVPDACASWIPQAVAQAKSLHAEAPFDVIYASGWPWTSFLIAEKVSRATGVPFVVDYRDLWNSPDNVEWDRTTWWQRRLNPLLERRVLRRAAGVIATTQSFLRLLPQENLPAHQFSITNGYDEDDFPTEAVIQKLSSPAPVRIVYTGVWRPGYGPDDLYAAVRLLVSRNSACLSRLRLTVAGFPPGRAQQMGLDAVVEERGRVTHAEALDLMRGATALYLPVSNGVYEYASMPGKLFEYLGSGRPILASALADSEVARTLAQVGGARRVAPTDAEALAALLEQMCNDSGNDIFSPRVQAELAMYTRANLTGKLAAALNRVVQQPRQH